MNLLDLRTVFIGYSINNAICAVVMALLWRQNHRRSPELGFWLANFILQFISIVLITLRGIVPDFLSIVVANVVGIAGLMLLFIGLERFVNKPGAQFHNYVLLALFTLIHIYFTYSQPNLAARNINYSAAISLVCFQAAWLMLHRVDASMRSETTNVGFVFAAFLITSVFRIFLDSNTSISNNIFESGTANILAILALQVLSLSLTFALLLMINHRLVAGLENDIAARKQAQEAAHESEIKWRSLFEILPVGVSVINSTGTVTDLNLALSQILDISLEGILHGNYKGRKYLRPDNTFLPPAEFPSIRAVKEQKIIKNVEIGVEKENGTVIWTNVSAVPLSYAAGSVIVTADITALKRSEKALSDITERLDLATRSAQLGIWDWDIQNDQLIWDQQMLKLYGIDQEHFLGAYLTWLNGIHPDDRAHSDEVSKKAVNGEMEYGTEFRVVWPDGSIHWLKADGQVIRDENGQAIRMVGVNYDITERKNAEEKLQKAYDNLNTAQRVAHVGSQEHDLTTNRLHWSEEALRIFGTPPGNFSESSNDFFNRIHPDDRDRVVAIIAQAYQSKKGTAFEHRILRSDGSVRYVEEQFDLVFNEKGDHIGDIGTIQDITERTQAAKSLSDAKWRLESIIQGTNVGTWEWNVQTGEAIFNEVWAEILGYTLAELAPISIKTWEALAHPDDLKQSEELLERHFAGELHFYDFESRMKHKDGHWVWVHDRGSVITHTSDGKPLMMFGTHTDITVRKQMDDQIRESEEKFSIAFHNIPDAVLITSLADGKIIEVNEGFFRISKLSSEEIRGKTFRDLNLWNETDRETLVAGLQKDGHVRNIETNFRIKTGQSIFGLLSSEIIKVQGLMCVLTIFRDLTEYKQAQELVIRQSEHLRILYEASRRLNRTLDLGDIYQAVCDFMSINTPNDSFVISSFNNETQLITCNAIWSEDHWLDVKSFPPIPLEPEGKGTQSLVIRSGQSMLINDYLTHFKSAQKAYYVDSMKSEVFEEASEGEEVIRSAMIVPLKIGNQVTGVIQVMSLRENAYTQDQLNLLDSLTIHIASAEQNALLFNRLQTELTTRKQIDASLYASEARYRALVENLGEGVGLVNPEEQFTFTNPAADEIFGLQPGGLLGRNLREFTTLDRFGVIRDQTSHRMSGAKSVYELEICCPDGEKRDLLVSAVPQFDSLGVFTGTFGVFRDITERKQTELSLQRRLMELEIVNKL